MYEKESDSEPVEEESQYITENTAGEIKEPKKEEKKTSHRKEKTTFLNI